MPDDTDIVPLQQPPAQDLLTLKGIAERLRVTYGRLRGFAEVPGVGEYVGAVSVPGVKGVRYRLGAEAQFRRLIAAQDAGLVTPRTAKAHLQSLLDSPNVENQQLDNAGPGNASIITVSGARGMRLRKPTLPPVSVSGGVVHG